MRHNIGRWERLLRVIAGSALVIAGWIYLEGFGIGAASLILVPVGTALLLTGVFSFCPLNVLFRHNSCRQCRQGVMDKHLPI
jgi:hypothetical protein